MIFCHKCGSEQLEGSEFCRKCGAQLLTENSNEPHENTIHTVSNIQNDQYVNSSKEPIASEITVAKSGLNTKTVVLIIACALILAAAGIIMAIMLSNNNQKEANSSIAYSENTSFEIKTEPKTEPQTEPPTEAPTEKPTEKKTEKVTEKPKETKPKEENYVSIGYGEVDVTSAGLYMRHVCDLDAEWVILVPDGTILELFDCGDPDWYYTEYDGEKGFVYADYVNYYGDFYPNIHTRSTFENRYGEIYCHGDIVPGYSTKYIFTGGDVSMERSSLGDTWHITAKNTYYAYGKTWYEVWDTDDGDYYGWVDEGHIKFY